LTHPCLRTARWRCPTHAISRSQSFNVLCFRPGLPQEHRFSSKAGAKVRTFFEPQNFFFMFFFAPYLTSNDIRRLRQKKKSTNHPKHPFSCLKNCVKKMFSDIKSPFKIDIFASNHTTC